jgi:hypothetical protein
MCSGRMLLGMLSCDWPQACYVCGLAGACARPCTALLLLGAACSVRENGMS